MSYKRISPQSIIEGGTSIQSATVYAPLCGGISTTSPFQSASTGISNSGYVLTSNGSSALPSFQASSGGSVCGTLGFFAILNSGTPSVTGTTGYYYGSTIAMSPLYDNSSGAFFAGTGGGSGTANAASYTIPVTGIYNFGMGIGLTGAMTGGNYFTFGPTSTTSFIGPTALFSGNINNLVASFSPLTGLTSMSNYKFTAGQIVYFFINCNSGGTATLQGGAGICYITGYRIA